MVTVVSQWPRISSFGPLLQQVKQLQPAITLGLIALIHGIPTEFWSILAVIWPRNSVKSGICPFSADNLHLADFQHFLPKLWHIFGKRLLEFGFSFSSEFLDKFWTKTWRKSAKKVPKSREIVLIRFTCSQ